MSSLTKNILLSSALIAGIVVCPVTARAADAKGVKDDKTPTVADESGLDRLVRQLGEVGAEMRAEKELKKQNEAKEAEAFPLSEDGRITKPVSAYPYANGAVLKEVDLPNFGKFRARPQSRVEILPDNFGTPQNTTGSR